MKRSSTATISALIAAVLTTTPAPADTILVPEEQPTIQAAINVSQNDDEIVLADATFTGAGNKNLLFGGRTLTLRSASGDRDACVIDCGNAGRFFNTGGKDVIVVQSITVLNGNAGAQNGGAAELGLGSSVSFIDCAFRNCAAEGGGALFIGGADAIIDGCIFENNTATRGGAVYADGIDNAVTLICTGSSFTCNVAIFGGGLRAEYLSSASRISDCIFRDNVVQFNAGGVDLQNSFSLDFSNNLFQGNVSGGEAGGLRIWNVGATLRNLVFLENEGLYGGGASMLGGSETILVNCLFAENRATGNPGPAGGGLCVYGASTPTLVNCSFAGNTSDEYAGALDAIQGSDVQLVGCVLWGNDAPEGPQIHIGYPDPEFEGGTVTVSYSDVEGGGAGVAVCCEGTLLWGAGNIDEDPLFVDPDDDDYRLAAGSPAIDAGDDEAVPAGVTDDIDGRPRLVNGNDEAPTTVDMGAHEFQTCPADIDRDDTVGFGDLLAVLAAWGEYAPCPPAMPEDIDHDCAVGFTDLLAVLGFMGAVQFVVAVAMSRSKCSRINDP